MIAAIGTMIGFYIASQMVALSTRKGEQAPTMITKVMALLTVVVAIFCTIAVNGAGPALP